MKKAKFRWTIGVFFPITLAACSGVPTPSTGGKSAEEAKIEKALSSLSPADRKLAEAQKFCAVEEKNRLGTMGTPVKVLVKGQAVFLCCDGCEDAAQAKPDKTLATVKELKAKAAVPPTGQQ